MVINDIKAESKQDAQTEPVGNAKSANNIESSDSKKLKHHNDDCSANGKEEHVDDCSTRTDLENYSVVEFKDNIEMFKQPFPTQIVKEKKDIPLCAQQFSDLTDPLYIKGICLEKVKEWKSLQIDDLCVNQILCGLTNQLFEVRVVKDEKEKPTVYRKKVLFRIYGKDVTMLYNSAFELEVFKTMSKYQLGPSLINTFDGGRIEEWLEGDPLSVTDLNNPAVLACLANLLGKYHTLSRHKTLPKHWDRTPCFFRRMKMWIGGVLSTKDLNTKDIDLEKYVKEADKYMTFLKEYTKSDNPANDVVFCHNDLQENNVISTRNCLRLIDFEYSDFNYLSVDVANLFAEATLDYTVNKYPFFSVDKTKYVCYELRNLFASVYLSVYLNVSTLPSDEKMIKPFLEAVEVQSMGNHLLWGFWSLIRSFQTKSYNEFDFSLYAKERFTMYDEWKERLIKEKIIPDF